MAAMCFALLLHFFFFNLRHNYLFCTRVLYQQYFLLVPRVQTFGLFSSKSSSSQCFPAAFLRDSKTKTESKTFAFFPFSFLLFFSKSKPLVPAMLNKSSAVAAGAVRSKKCDLCLGFKLMCIYTAGHASPLTLLRSLANTVPEVQLLIAVT